ncbi:hypothetical protein FEM48_Zijuj04G0192600 [Ziziphus jujuba var. spinosa]|uniref:glutathione transferase n=1 Tax=Ziziphus jujuba var. spinosa TaxID=714518 RepID=A0A978VLP4_ZIZJJ|nr:hypothetical protein FEM48_Zijuj04G0192600 [Ziziphus jujuba var. spinosa]
MTSKGEALLLDFWASPFCARAKISLYEKGVNFECREEDLFGGKSDLLLRSNPIHQKVPVLLHNGKPILESTNIVTYIDAVWPSPPLIPSSPYEAAQASQIWRSQGDEQEVAKKNFIEILQQLEEALGNKKFFAGDVFGFVDILLIPITSWFLTYEKIGSFKVEDRVPKLSAWIKRTKQRETVAKALPDPEKVYEFIVGMRKQLGIE